MSSDASASTVVLATSSTLGGAEHVLLDVLRSWEKEQGGPAPQVVLAGEGPLADSVRCLALEPWIVPLPPVLGRLGEAAGKTKLLLAAPTLIPYLASLSKALAGARTVRSNDLKGHLLATLAAPRGAKLVWHLHDDLTGRRLMPRLLRSALKVRRRRVDEVIGVSRYVAEKAADSLGGAVRTVTVRPNRVEAERFPKRSGTGPDPECAAWLDSLAGFGPEPEPEAVRVGLVATFAVWKGQDVLIDAAADLVRRVPQLAERVRWYLVGGPIYDTAGSQWTSEALRSRIAERGVAGRVRLTGPIPHDVLWRVYHGLDLAVHASTRPEPFGLTLAEALACGVPVATTGLGGAAEVVAGAGPDAEVLSVRPSDSQDLAMTITRRFFPANLI